jgi:hypothetical protein
MANEIQEQNLSTESTHPAPGRRQMGPTNWDWWPNKLDLRALRQNSPLSDPMGKEFNYAEEFKSLDLDAVIKDLRALDDELAGMVAGRLWPLWAVVHSYGVARRRYVPHRRRPRRGRPCLPTFCAYR